MKQNRRKNILSPELRNDIKRRGVDAVNSDEEKEFLDEAQQERFVSQMTIIVDEYIARWRSLFAWLSVIVLYVHLGCLIGLLPLTRWITTYGPLGSGSTSIIVKIFTAPLTLGTSFYSLGYMSALFGLFTLTCDGWIVKSCLSLGAGNNRRSIDTFHYRKVYWTMSFVITIGWLLLAASTTMTSLLWGKHTVIIVSTPLLGYAGEIFLSSRSLAVAGLEKLDSYKYSYKKL